LEINLDFDLLYEDPDFDGKLTSLVDIEELPQKAVVHISPPQESSSIASTWKCRMQRPKARHFRKACICYI